MWAATTSTNRLRCWHSTSSFPRCRPPSAIPMCGRPTWRQIRIDESQRLAVPARRGLIPSCSKDDGIAQHTFNARGETVAERPSVRAAFKRRCVVPVSAFFNWQSIIGKKKRKLRITGPAQHPLALAASGSIGSGQRRENRSRVTRSSPPTPTPTPTTSWHQSMSACRSFSGSATGRPGSIRKRTIRCCCSPSWCRARTTG